MWAKDDAFFPLGCPPQQVYPFEAFNWLKPPICTGAGLYVLFLTALPARTHKISCSNHGAKKNDSVLHPTDR